MQVVFGEAVGRVTCCSANHRHVIVLEGLHHHVDGSAKQSHLRETMHSLKFHVMRAGRQRH